MDRVSKEREEGFVEEERRAFFEGDGEGEEGGLVEQRRDDGDVETRVEFIEGGRGMDTISITVRNWSILDFAVATGTLDKVESRLHERFHISPLEMLEGAGLEFGDVGGGRSGWGVGIGTRASGVRCWGWDDVGGFFFGEFETAGEKGLADFVTVFGGDEDEIRVVGCDEEDGHTRHGY